MHCDAQMLITDAHLIFLRLIEMHVCTLMLVCSACCVWGTCIGWVQEGINGDPFVHGPLFLTPYAHGMQLFFSETQRFCGNQVWYSGNDAQGVLPHEGQTHNASSAYGSKIYKHIGHVDGLQLTVVDHLHLNIRVQPFIAPGQQGLTCSYQANPPLCDYNRTVRYTVIP